MMSIIVSKFGGSSMADAIMFQRVKEILQNKRRPHYIIVSAPGKRSASDEKITDLLCRAHSIFASGGNPADLIQHVKQRFCDIVAALHLEMNVQALLESLEEDVYHSRDRAASRGEYLCARIFAAYAELPFVDATELIHFDANGRILPEDIRSSVRAMAARLPCAVIPGFYGSKPSGEIMTFTRGGSDITGALIAAALHADVYENWTDVDGLMSIDPNLCPGAVHHAAVSYRQMRRLAKAGAHVLHPFCLEPVQEAGVPTALRNTFFPERCGTYISNHVHKTVPCICLRRNVRAIGLDALDAGERQIVRGLRPEFYRSMDQREYILLESPDGLGERADMVNVFSLPDSLCGKALEIMRPICWRKQDGCLTMLTKSPLEITSLNALHALLIHENPHVQDFRSA